MLSLPDRAAVEAALQTPLDPQLHCVLADRLQDSIACDLEDETHIIIVQPGDGEDDWLHHAAFSPFRDRTGEVQYGDPDYTPPWDWAERHPWGWELIRTIGNSGFAIIILVRDTEGIDPTLITLLRKHHPLDR